MHRILTGEVLLMNVLGIIVLFLLSCSTNYPEGSLRLDHDNPQIVQTGYTQQYTQQGMQYSDHTMFIIQFKNGKYEVVWETKNAGNGLMKRFDIGDVDNDGKKEIAIINRETSVKKNEETGKRERSLENLDIRLFEYGSLGDPSFIQKLIEKPIKLEMSMEYSPGGYGYLLIADANNDKKNEIIVAFNNQVQVYELKENRVIVGKSSSSWFCIFCQCWRCR